MSFSRSRKAEWRARVSGDASHHLYNLEDQPLSQVDLSLNIPSRPERLVIKDDDSIDKCFTPRKPASAACECEKEPGRNADPTPFSPPVDDEQIPLPQQPTRALSKSREIAVLIMICMVQLIPLSALGTSFPTADTIAASFNITDPGILPWTVAAYALTFGTFILIAGRLGDIFGHKRMMTIGFAIMSLSSLLAGLSIYSTYVVYFVARALQGIGSAFMQPNGLALLGEMYPARSQKKNLAFALFGAMAAPGAYLGMLFGALITHHSSWAWASHALALAAAVCAILTQTILPSPPSSPSSLPTLLRSIDWAGAATGTTGLSCITIAWAQAPSLGWNTQYIYCLAIIGLLTTVGFTIIELRLAPHPLLPLRTLPRAAGPILLSTGLGWASFGIYIFYLWQLLLHTRHLAPLGAALQLLPVVPIGLLANATAGLLLARTRASLLLLAALLAFTGGAVLLALAPPAQTYWALTLASLLLVPFGMDLSFPAATLTMSDALARGDRDHHHQSRQGQQQQQQHEQQQQQGVAAALVATVVNYSMSLGLGVASTVQRYVSHEGAEARAGWSGALYVSVGLGVLGTGVAGWLFFVIDGRSARAGVSMPVPERLLTAEVSRGGLSTETLWEPHPAVRPLGGANLVARD